MSINEKLFESIAKGAPIATIIAVTLGASMTFFAGKQLDLKINDNVKSIVVDVGYSRERMVDLESDIAAIKAQLEGIKELPSDLPVSSKVKEIEAKIDTVNSKLDALNKAILESPEKALALPLLRRDMDSLQKQYVSAVNNLEQEVSRAYDIFKWVTGTMFLGVISLAVGVFVKPRKNKGQVLQSCIRVDRFCLWLDQ